MSKILLSFLLSELRTVRVICRNEECKRIVEMEMASLSKLTNDASAECKFC